MGFFERHFQTFVPPSLQALASKKTSKLLAALSAQECSKLEAVLVAKPALTAPLIRCLVGSEYLLESCCREPFLLFDWLLTEAAHSPLSANRMNELAPPIAGANRSTDSLDSSLRNFRRRIMLAIMWQDLNRSASFKETAAMTTALAELCLQRAATFHFDRLVEEVGNPIGNKTAGIQPFLVIGMGKLGGGELNISSDIDLIFTFPEAGHTDNAKKSIDNQLFFYASGSALDKNIAQCHCGRFCISNRYAFAPLRRQWRIGAQFFGA